MAKVINIREIRDSIYGECDECDSCVDPYGNRNYCGNCGAKLEWDKSKIERQNRLTELRFTESLKDEDWYDEWINHERY